MNNEQKLIDKLKRLASNNCWCDDDDFCPMDFSGSNFDDAYYGGRKDGETKLARSILKEFFDNN